MSQMHPSKRRLSSSGQTSPLESNLGILLVRISHLEFLMQCVSKDFAAVIDACEDSGFMTHGLCDQSGGFLRLIWPQSQHERCGCFLPDWWKFLLKEKPRVRTSYEFSH
jgi:hypothetical protein